MQSAPLPTRAGSVGSLLASSGNQTRALGGAHAHKVISPKSRLSPSHGRPLAGNASPGVPLQKVRVQSPTWSGGNHRRKLVSSPSPQHARNNARLRESSPPAVRTWACSPVREASPNRGPGSMSPYGVSRVPRFPGLGKMLSSGRLSPPCPLRGSTGHNRKTEESDEDVHPLQKLSSLAISKFGQCRTVMPASQQNAKTRSQQQATRAPSPRHPSHQSTPRQIATSTPRHRPNSESAPSCDVPKHGDPATAFRAKHHSAVALQSLHRQRLCQEQAWPGHDASNANQLEDVLEKGCTACLQEQAAEDPDQLDIDAVVHVEGCTYKITTRLGAGNFGCVWGADCENGGKYAIKEIFCKSSKELKNAMLEEDVLRSLGSHVIDNTARWPIPELVSSDIRTFDYSEVARVRLVMTWIRGVPLVDVFATQCPQSLAKCTWGFDHLINASHFAKELLAQLAPACESFASYVYHRDINPRNILVDTESDGEVHFGLIDFGMCADAANWRAGIGVNNLGGDGRYWPYSAWYGFQHGLKELAEHPALFHEFTVHLDMHSLGISALQCFIEKMPPPDTLRLLSSLQRSNVNEELLASFETLREAWLSYWVDVTRYWGEISEVSKNGCNFKPLREAYVRNDVQGVVDAHLDALRAAISELREACEGADVLTLLDVLLVMIRSSAVAAENPSWQDVRAVLMTAPCKSKSDSCEYDKPCRTTSTPTTASPGDSPPRSAASSVSLSHYSSPRSVRDDAFDRDAFCSQ